ncbi:MAG: 30S ribosomal protein S12 methylthiotransferase RimO [Oligoflexia bacterium]|nr:30S ribosomal protein S12 methylthiotransferase RimO [Oligoflexia bacterium]
MGCSVAQRVHVVSLGCPKNRIDTEIMVGKLMSTGFELVDSPSQADVIVVNTCAFIQPATEESIETVLEMAGYKDTGHCRKLVVTGCMVQRFGKALEDELPEVDHFLGTGEYHRIADLLAARSGTVAKSYVDTPLYIHDELAPRISSWRPHSAYLKISEGCDHRCAFCIIPQLRGRLRSRTVASLVAEARNLALQGVVELNLVSQDSTAYGRDLADGSDLGQLLRALTPVAGIEWIRLHYAYPIGLPESLLHAIADEPKVCSYLDMPLQHASGPMLKAMRRGVTRAGQEAILQRVRKFVPDVVIRTTFIVGFPGETDQDFAELVDFVQAQRFDRVGVFTYCQEDGTPAATLPGQVPQDVKLARQAELMSIQAEISRASLASWVGRTTRVLVDGPSDESPLVLAGRMATQAPEVDGAVFLDGPSKQVVAGMFVRARITQSADHDLVGQVVD